MKIDMLGWIVKRNMDTICINNLLSEVKCKKKLTLSQHVNILKYNKFLNICPKIYSQCSNDLSWLFTSCLTDTYTLSVRDCDELRGCLVKHYKIYTERSHEAVLYMDCFYITTKRMFATLSDLVHHYTGNVNITHIIRFHS